MLTGLRNENNLIPSKYAGFICPICRSQDYKQITVHNGISGPGGRTMLDHNVCNGYSVHFEDAEKFTKAKQ